MEHVDTIIIGAGVVGLAIARALALQNRDVLILESESAIGSVTSSRNSGVIHAGIYYGVGSLKAQLCVKGRDQLYAYCAERGIPHKRRGKLIVVTAPDQTDKLQRMKSRAEENGVMDLRILTPEEAKKMEPEVYCTAAIYSPSTGIIDVHEYMHALLGDAEANGATLALHSPVISGEVTENGFILNTDSMNLSCSRLINAAGLGAQDFAKKLRGLDAATIQPIILAKGSYFSLTGKQPFQHLIYPLPVMGSSGLHANCDLAGRVRFGPDLEWVDTIDYKVDVARKPLFEEAVRRYWPALPTDALQPDYAGIRPKIGRGGPHETDFMIQTDRDHHVKGLINLYGIESPGLTASLAIGDVVAEIQ